MSRSNFRASAAENGNINNNRGGDDDDDDDHRGNDGGGGVGPTITIKVCGHGSNQPLHLPLPSHSTFGDLKRVIAQETGLDPKDQKLLFRGTEKEDQEYLHMAGVKDNAKVLLLEDKGSKETKVVEVKESTELSRGHEAVAEVRSEVDKLTSQLVALETAVKSGTKVADKEFIILSELLMRQLLKLDGIEAEGEGKVQRKIEVRRVQSLVEKVDALKTRNSNPFGDCNKSVAVTTKWETFDSGAPTQSSTVATQDWEVFE